MDLCTGKEVEKEGKGGRVEGMRRERENGKGLGREEGVKGGGGGEVKEGIKAGKREEMQGRGDLVPKAGMLMVELEDGRSFAVRPSGTEPKIKYYLFGRDEPGAADLEASKKKVSDGLEALWAALKDDADARMA